MQRTLKFAKYLPLFQWKPFIIKADLTPAEEKDGFLLNELSDEVVIYNAFYPRFTKSAKDDQVSKNVGGKVSWLRKHIAQCLRAIACIPDDRIFWLPFALKRALKAIREKSIDVIYTTSNPYTNHLIGYMLKIITKKPWVADFRDPWTENIYHSARYYRSPFSPLRKRIDIFLEKRIVRNADRIIGTTEEIVDSFVGRYGGARDVKYAVITNGYDADDFLLQQPGEKDAQKPFVICYCGSFRRVSPVNFLNALRKVIDEHPEIENDVRVSFVGHVPAEMISHIRRLRLERQVDLIGYKTHKDALKYLLNSDLLLLILTSDAREKLILPGKIFEYLAANKPILALLPEGPASEMISKYQAGKVVHPESIDEIKAAIYQYYQAHKNGGIPGPNSQNIDSFERKELTKHLADIFESALVR